MEFVVWLPALSLVGIMVLALCYLAWGRRDDLKRDAVLCLKVAAPLALFVSLFAALVRPMWF